MGTKATISSTTGTRVSINNQTRPIVKTVAIAGTSGGSGVSTISNLSDVDMSDADTGETLVYDESLGKFIVKQMPGVDGGSF